MNAAANAPVGEAPALAAGKAAETADEAAPVWENAEAEYEEEAAYEETAHAPTEALTAAPTEAPTAAPTEAPAPEPTAEPSEQEKTGFLSEAGAFFADMGDFLLAVLPSECFGRNILHSLCRINILLCKILSDLSKAFNLNVIFLDVILYRVGKQVRKIFNFLIAAVPDKL